MSASKSEADRQHETAADLLDEKRVEAVYQTIRSIECGRRQTRWCDNNDRTACSCMTVAVRVIEALEAVQ